MSRQTQGVVVSFRHLGQGQYFAECLGSLPLSVFVRLLQRQCRCQHPGWELLHGGVDTMVVHDVTIIAP